MSGDGDSKAVYAQSSDIQSRTYLQYRRDMKRKAIVELEMVDWFERKLKALHNTADVTLAKAGGDAHIWFLRSGKISGAPDYEARIDGAAHRFEFQYASRDDLDFYDFKVSKVGKKIKGVRKPHSDREFLYILMPSCKFAVFAPEWVMQNGAEAGVPAWGNRTAYRVPAERFMSILAFDEELGKKAEIVDRKIAMLEAQSRFIPRESERLSGELQNVVDREQAFTIIPKTLDGFYAACFLMDQLHEYPRNHSLWLVYAASFYREDLNSHELARLAYSLDFLYGGAADLERNVLNALVQAMTDIGARIQSMQRDGMQTDADLSPNEEVVNFLFTVNLYEDIVQELRFLYGVDRFAPIAKIFQTVKDLNGVVARLK